MVKPSRSLPSLLALILCIIVPGTIAAFKGCDPESREKWPRLEVKVHLPDDSVRVGEVKVECWFYCVKYLHCDKTKRESVDLVFRNGEQDVHLSTLKEINGLQITSQPADLTYIVKSTRRQSGEIFCFSPVSKHTCSFGSLNVRFKNSVRYPTTAEVPSRPTAKKKIPREPEKDKDYVKPTYTARTENKGAFNEEIFTQKNVLYLIIGGVTLIVFIMIIVCTVYLIMKSRKKETHRLQPTISLYVKPSQSEVEKLYAIPYRTDDADDDNKDIYLNTPKNPDEKPDTDVYDVVTGVDPNLRVVIGEEVEDEYSFVDISRKPLSIEEFNSLHNL